MNMNDPNKSFVTVLLNKDGKAEDSMEESINPDQGLIDASSELIKAIEKKDPARIVRVFKAMYKMCDDMETEESDSEEC